MTAASYRALTKTPDDIALGTELVREYVVATADETGTDLDVILPLIPDLDDFGGRYFDGGGYIVATVDNEIVGGVGITPRTDNECEMNRLWIRPAFRSRALGRGLSESALAHAKTLGFTRMVLDVVPARTGAIALYRALGFREIEPFHEYPFAMVAFARDL